MENEYPTKNIRITDSIKDKLDRIKVHRNQPYYEVIKKLVDFYEKNKQK